VFNVIACIITAFQIHSNQRSLCHHHSVTHAFQERVVSAFMNNPVQVVVVVVMTMMC
jgi:hypothetical protein